jgi:hypothetical protein
MARDSRNDELVTVVTFGTAHEAEIARGVLETNDIDVFLSDQAISRIASHLTPLIGGIKLQVPRQDVDKVRKLLSDCNRHARPLSR